QIVRRWIVNEFFVAEVEHDPDAASRGLLRARLEILFRNQRSRRVARRVDDDATRAGGYCIEHQSSGDGKAVGRLRLHDDRPCLSELHLLDQRGPIRRVKDDLVTRPKERERRVEERLFATSTGDDLT